MEGVFFVYNCILNLTKVCHLCVVLEPLDAVHYPPTRLTNLDQKGLAGLLEITMGEQCLRPNKCSKLKLYLGFTKVCILIM
jgi:hypothetical protein